MARTDSNTNETDENAVKAIFERLRSADVEEKTKIFQELKENPALFAAFLKMTNDHPEDPQSQQGQ